MSGFRTLFMLYLQVTMPNTARGCVKTPDTKFGNDQIFDMGNFGEMSRRIQWLENEFSHSLALEPTAIAHVSRTVAVIPRPFREPRHPHCCGSAFVR